RQARVARLSRLALGGRQACAPRQASAAPLFRSDRRGRIGARRGVEAIQEPAPGVAGRVVSLILRQGLGMTLTGVAVGLAGALAVTRLFKSLLVGVSTNDGVSFAATTALLILVALVAPTCRPGGRRPSIRSPRFDTSRRD